MESMFTTYFYVENGWRSPLSAFLKWSRASIIMKSGIIHYCLLANKAQTEYSPLMLSRKWNWPLWIVCCSECLQWRSLLSGLILFSNEVFSPSACSLPMEVAGGLINQRDAIIQTSLSCWLPCLGSSAEGGAGWLNWAKICNCWMMDEAWGWEALASLEGSEHHF